MEALDSFGCSCYHNAEKMLKLYLGGFNMKYEKPTVLKPETVQSAKCGDGPCGRPCSVNRA